MQGFFAALKMTGVGKELRQNAGTCPGGHVRQAREAVSLGVSHSAISEQVLPHPGHPMAAESSLAGAYAVLFKLRVSAMVVITAAAGLYLGDLRSGVNPFHLQAVFALAGIALVTCGSSVLNQALERRSDGRMPRTRKRPMVTGRIGLTHGLLLGFGAVAGGTWLLAAETNPLTTTLTLLTATGYVAIYTPLKRMTSLNTFIGAFPGALPPLIGWTAARGLIEWPAVALFAVLFVWQFPHFMAIGWMYRDEYRHGGIRLAATQQPIAWAAWSTTLQALFYAVLMIPAALWTSWLGVTGKPYAVIATVLSLGYLGYTVRFAMILRDPAAKENRGLAKDLLRASVIYLPLLLAAMLANAQGRAPF
jgi:protoheme IX farnesyltransferase